MADELHAESIALARIWTIKRCLIHPSNLMIHKMCLCNACTQLHGKSDFLLDAVMFSSQDLHIYIFFHITRFTAVSGYFSFPLLSETSLFWKIVKHIFTFIEFCAAWCGVAAKLCKKITVTRYCGNVVQHYYCWDIFGQLCEIQNRWGVCNDVRPLNPLH